MHHTAHLRRQAEFCLRLAQSCFDQSTSRHLSYLAARYHEAALRAEFGLSAGGNAQDYTDDEVTESQLVWH